MPLHSNRCLLIFPAANAEAGLPRGDPPAPTAHLSTLHPQLFPKQARRCSTLSRLNEQSWEEPGTRQQPPGVRASCFSRGRFAAPLAALLALAKSRVAPQHREWRGSPVSSAGSRPVELRRLDPLLHSPTGPAHARTHAHTHIGPF